MVKRVIIVRKDLKNTEGHKIRSGKYIAQAGHAIEGSLIKDLFGKSLEGEKGDIKADIHIQKETPLHYYLTGIFKKVTLVVNSKEELLEMHKKITDAGYKSTLIIDSGLTEFGGVKTPTCLGIEPLFEEDVDKLTGHLKLY